MSSTGNNYSDTLSSLSEQDDGHMIRAVQQNGRRNALADLGSQLAQFHTAMVSSEIDNMTPHFQSMSIKPRVVDDNSDMRKIRIDIEGASGTLYDGENFQLLFKFSDQYPFDSPQSRPPDND
ncbi:unnamed protein product, partial [Rotaria sp. Silwood1]